MQVRAATSRSGRLIAKVQGRIAYHGTVPSFLDKGQGKKVAEKP
jgi:hypothetical protein